MSEQTSKKELTIYDRVSSGGFSKSLPAHIAEDKFVRSIHSTLAMNPQVRKIAGTPAGAESLMLACSKAATDGLIIDGREAALVPMTVKVKGKDGGQDTYEDRLTYIPMVQGLMKRARNSGQIASLTAQVVYANDRFHYTMGDDERITHEPLMDGERGRGRAVYAIATMKDGTRVREVMFEGAVMKIAAQSKNSFQYDQEKGKNWGEWWRKCVIRRIIKYIASSADIEALGPLIQHSDEEFDYDNQEPGIQAPAGKKRGGAAAALRDVTPPRSTSDEDQSQDDGKDYDEVPPKTIDNDDGLPI